jgi:hypothetical protein
MRIQSRRNYSERLFPTERIRETWAQAQGHRYAWSLRLTTIRFIILCWRDIPSVPISEGSIAISGG